MKALTEPMLVQIVVYVATPARVLPTAASLSATESDKLVLPLVICVWGATVLQMITEGEAAPDFSLRGFYEGEFGTHQLSDYTTAGEWVLLTFYAFDFNPVCTSGMCSLRDAEFLQFEDNLTVLGISGDGPYAHRQFAQNHNINYPLLADTSREVGEAYGVLLDDYEESPRIHQRSAFLIDPDQTVQLVVTIDAEDPEEISVGPLVEAIRTVRG
ncbi:peroxiredoxin family protein [Haloarcula sp. CBA1130]|uniref:peroxiredoxin family protein n=1 Tax=unclassified Haloarcula TaxID=2624677 RepID=UPI00124790F0|nr:MULTISPECIES: peroxiredoxin family protein [unclassified Haloarcula]KAA9396155.1 peroxiredoxin family protein [Haloarcula sp. CBA1129]KAA9400316.1 peroxiredoxin family protein [Haloarcula sp. CBA1130]